MCLVAIILDHGDTEHFDIAESPLESVLVETSYQKIKIACTCMYIAIETRGGHFVSSSITFHVWERPAQPRHWDLQDRVSGICG